MSLKHVGNWSSEIGRRKSVVGTFVEISRRKVVVEIRSSKFEIRSLFIQNSVVEICSESVRRRNLIQSESGTLSGPVQPEN